MCNNLSLRFACTDELKNWKWKRLRGLLICVRKVIIMLASLTLLLILDTNYFLCLVEHTKNEFALNYNHSRIVIPPTAPCDAANHCG